MADQKSTLVSRGGPRVLPPSFTEERFDKVLDAVVKVIGHENVSRDGWDGNLEGPKGQVNYGDIWPLAAPDEHQPSAAIRPATLEELQQVVRIANEQRLPVWTVSRGKNLGYGGSAPVVKGTVVLDLHRMNKIIDVSEEYAYAIVEPGVSFFDLYDHVQAKGYDLWPSCAAIGWGSVLGNTLERGMGYTPYGEHSQQQCGMEVLLPTGEIIRTGMGALPNSPMWPLFKGGYGPGIDGLFYQSNLGIVTKLGIHLTPAPTHLLSCEASVPREEDLEAFVPILAGLQREGIVQNHASLWNHWRQAFASGDSEAIQAVTTAGLKGGCTPESELLELQKRKGWGYWTAGFAIYGASEESVNAHRALVEQRLAKVPEARLEVTTFRGKENRPIKARDMPPIPIPYDGKPHLEALPLMDIRGNGGGHFSFAPLFPPGGPSLQKWFKTARQQIAVAGFDAFVDFHVYGRYVIGIVLVVYAPGEGQRARDLFTELVEEAKAVHGVAEYRSHVSYMDHVRGRFDFGDDALGRFVTRLKNELDPHAILSQGKSGIWGQSKT